MIGSAPTFSVSDFVAVFNQSLDVLYPEVIITGELANFRVSKNTWVYFDLKDELASVRFFGTARALPGPLEDGMLLEVVGRPRMHPKFGFNINFDSIQAVGDGSIKKAQSLLEKKLSSEGLFDARRKRALPFAPTKIGLIGSTESAGYGDFMKIVAKRWPSLEVELFNVQVQGQDAPQQIVSALQSANQKVDQLEVVVVIRGGGSRDDLLAFDHELVVRAVASSRIPTLVAIGHERDLTLSERAADLRASTPSNAADLLVPDKAHELEQLTRINRYMAETLASKLALTRANLRAILQEMTSLLEHRVEDCKSYLHHSKRLLNTLDPRLPLKRGFVMARTSNGELIRSSKQASKVRKFGLEFDDGSIIVETKE